jgi:hypothetical protein
VETHEIHKLFAGRVCQSCGGWKVSYSAFCRACYRQLPRALRTSLWKKFSEGFPEAYQASLSWFREHPFQGEHRAQQKSLFDSSAPDRAEKGGKPKCAS